MKQSSNYNSGHKKQTNPKQEVGQKEQGTARFRFSKKHTPSDEMDKKNKDAPNHIKRSFQEFYYNSHYNQAELALMLEVDPATISRMLNGKRRLTLAVLIALRSYCDISIDEFVDGTYKPH